MAVLKQLTAVFPLATLLALPGLAATAQSSTLPPVSSTLSTVTSTLSPVLSPVSSVVSTASSALSPASSTELQNLLQVQSQQVSVLFSNFTPPRTPASTFDRLFLWNQIALDTTAIDHTPVQPGEARVFGEQFGPTRASRAMAIIHIAMFEAVDAVTHDYKSYTNLPQVNRGDVSVDYAIAEAAHDTLVNLYPSQKARLDAILAADTLLILDNGARLAAGQALGAAAANSILTLRANDGSQVPDPRVGGPFTPMVGVGHWSPDPVSGVKLYLGAYWSKVKPFTLSSADQFRAPPPPALTDPVYTQAFNQVKTEGGDSRFGTATTRTDAETTSAIYWSYDGTPALCAPPRLYNQVANAIVLQRGMNKVSGAARMLALINTSMADAAISAWDTKWFYQYWRPVTAIRSLQQGGNGEVIPDPSWYPLGGQATNARGPNFTPPFPAYVSGHAAIGGALFQTMRHYYPDATPFTFVSDEWNGVNRDAVTDQPRPLRPLHFSSFSDAEYQNAESRIYLGVHWQFDSDQGTLQGRHVADWVWSHAFQPVAAMQAQ